MRENYLCALSCTLHCVLQFSISTLFHCLDGPYLLFLLGIGYNGFSSFFFRFSFLGSFPQHPSLSLLWIGQIGTCVPHYLPLHSVFLFRIGNIGPSFPQLTLYSPFTNLTSLLFSGSSVFSFFVSSFLHAGRHG